MAVLYVNEYQGTGADLVGDKPAAEAPPIATQHVSIGASSTQSSAFNSATRLIEVHTDAICSVNIGTNPTAAATAWRLAANETRYYWVRPGDKIAVITNT